MIIDLSNGNLLVTGTVTRDAELKYVGQKQTPVCTFSLAAGKRKDTTTIFVNCQARRALSRYASLICKGDSVCAVGRVEEWEYNGKTYKSLACEWLNAAIPTAEASAAPIPDLTDAPPGGMSPDAYKGLSDADGDLPF